MWIAVMIVVLLAGVTLTTVGLRGRRTDDHPVCRRCGYDLTGAAGERCPECGGDLRRRRAVRVGHRVRRRGLAAVGVVLSGVPVAVIVARARHVDWIAREPVWWLRHELNGGPASQAAALAELQRRLAAGQLSPSQVAAVVDRALAVQADLRTPWDGRWGGFVEAAEDAGRLDRQRWVAFARGVRPVTLTVRPHVRPRDELPIRITKADGESAMPSDTYRASPGRFDVYVAVEDLRCDGRPTPARWSADYERLVVGLQDGSPLPVGRHVLGLTARVTITNGPAVLPVIGGELQPPKPADEVSTFDVPLTADFDVVAADREPAVLIASPKLRAVVGAAIRIARVDVSSDGTFVEVDFSDPPVPCEFSVSVRSAGRPELALEGTAACEAKESIGYGLGTGTSVGPVDKVDVILRPQPDRARERVDPTPIWGEPIVVHDVPVRRR